MDVLNADSSIPTGMTSEIESGAAGLGQLTTLSNGLPRFNVSSLNGAIGTLLERGFAPRFLVDATVSHPQLKKGHLWMTLVDESASISAVVWSSQLNKLSHKPTEGDGVTVVGKLNFWGSRASLCVQILEIRPSLSSVLRRFERVRALLQFTDLFNADRKRPLPVTPRAIALLTSVPSSALADMLRTASERWPATRIIVVPIPVQGAVEEEICQTLKALSSRATSLNLDAVVLARGGGSREDLSVFDGEELARTLAACPIPTVTGLGHEDDTTIADLVADYRAATPTAALVALLPDRRSALTALDNLEIQLKRQLSWRLQLEQHHTQTLEEKLRGCSPARVMQRQRQSLEQFERMLDALSPLNLLRRGFCLVRLASTNHLIRSAQEVDSGTSIQVEWADGIAEAAITRQWLDKNDLTTSAQFNNE